MHLPVKGIHGSASLCQTRATFYDQWMAYTMCTRTEQHWIMMNHATTLILICTLLWQTWPDYVPWLLMAHCEYHILPSSECYTQLWYRKSKAVPLQACSDPEGSRKLSFPDFMTTAQDDGKLVSLMHRPPLPPGTTPGTHFC